MKKKILVTGASGYIGRDLLKRLLKEEYKLVVLVRDLGKMPAWLLGNQNLQIVEGDLSNKKALKKAVGKADVVFHLAAALRMFEKNRELYQTNVVGLKNLLSACKKANRKIRFIFASTIDVGKRETDYARSKIKGEEIIKKFCSGNSKIKYTIIRIGNIWGPGEEGMMGGVAKIMDKRNWQGSILYHVLGNKLLYLIEMKNLVEKLVDLVKNPKATNKTLSLIDETLTAKDLVWRLKKQKLISGYPKKLPFGGIIIKVWKFLGRIFKRGDLLVYLACEK